MSFDLAKIEIRRLAEPDLDTVIGIAELLEDAPDWPRKLYEEALNTDSPRRRIAMVAWDTRNREVIGFTVASLVVPEAELETIAVAVDFQRRGVGRRLLTALKGELRQKGAEELLLEVRASNRSAIRLYEALHFRQTGARPRYYADPQEDAVLMSLRLV
jgi:[ribosomal protein S18]-alanine N-acetyltransferase